jgi:hypothetical protein
MKWKHKKTRSVDGCSVQKIVYANERAMLRWSGETFAVSESTLINSKHSYESESFAFIVCYTYNIVTYEGFAWRILTGSGMDNWIYWHFFTIIINYNSSQLMTA